MGFNCNTRQVACDTLANPAFWGYRWHSRNPKKLIIRIIWDNWDKHVHFLRLSKHLEPKLRCRQGIRKQKHGQQGGIPFKMRSRNPVDLSLWAFSSHVSSFTFWALWHLRQAKCNYPAEDLSNVLMPCYSMCRYIYIHKMVPIEIDPIYVMDPDVSSIWVCH